MGDGCVQDGLGGLLEGGLVLVDNILKIGDVDDVQGGLRFSAVVVVGDAFVALCSS